MTNMIIIDSEQLNNSQNSFIIKFKKNNFYIKKYDYTNPFSAIDKELERNLTIALKKIEKDHFRSGLIELCHGSEQEAIEIAQAYSQDIAHIANHVISINEYTRITKKTVSKYDLYQDSESRICIDVVLENLGIGINEEVQEPPAYVIPEKILTHFIYDSVQKEFQLNCIRVSHDLLYQLCMQSNYIPSHDEINQCQANESKKFYQDYPHSIAQLINKMHLWAKLEGKIDKDFADNEKNKLVKNYIKDVFTFIDCHAFDDSLSFERLFRTMIRNQPPDMNKLTTDEKRSLDSLILKTTQLFIYKIIEKQAAYGHQIAKRSPQKAQIIFDLVKDLKRLSDYYCNHEKKIDEFVGHLDNKLQIAQKKLNHPRHMALVVFNNLILCLTGIGALFVVGKSILYAVHSSSAYASANKRKSSPLLFAQTRSAKIVKKSREMVQEMKKSDLLLLR